MTIGKVSLLLAIIFFGLGLWTLPHYGINWDTINHLPRGQAYLHYFLTGKENYSDLPLWFADWSNPNHWYWQKPESLFIDTNLSKKEVPTRSQYQVPGADFSYFINHDGDGHPPLSDILSSVFNRVLFGKLRLINDIDSYRVYGLVLAAALVGLLYYWISSEYGQVAGLISAISLAIYPLFWSESHFNNEKDVPETVFWSFFLYLVYRGLNTKNYKLLILSGLFFGLALGTKFNILFSVFIIGPYVTILLIKKYFQPSVLLKVFTSGLIAIVIGVGLFVGSWPYLWGDPITRIPKVFSFYKDIGTGGFDARFVGPLGIRTYPLTWIAYTTPLVILGLSILGLFFTRKDRKYLFFLLWLTVPIARETWPGASFYGGVRQIMEYIPALAIFSGFGASFLYHKLKSKIVLIIVLLCFIPITIKLIQIHPNENVYFNSLIGGLSGAKRANLPYWGFSFGNAYRQGIMWLNANAQPNAKLVYAYELIPNFPRLWLRPDIELNNHLRSGYKLQGEYAITLTYQGTKERSYYDSYLENYLVPVYEVQVDNTSILKIWKNDSNHLQKSVVEHKVSSKLQKVDTGLKFDLGSMQPLSRLEINYDNRLKTCPKLTSGYVEISKDGNTWTRLPGVLPDDWRISALGEQPSNGHFIEPFLGQMAKNIFISLTPQDTCLKNVLNYSVYSYESK